MSRSTPFPPEVYERVLAIVQQRPGINSHNLAMAAGLPPKRAAGRNSLTYRRVNAVLDELEQRGEIRTELIWDMPGQPRRVFAADYHPPPKRPLFQPAAGHQNQCKTWIDPAIRGTWSRDGASVRSPIADIPIDSFNPTPSKKSMSKSKYRQQITEILEQIELSGTLPMPTMSAICKQVGCADNWFSLNPDMRSLYLRIKDQLTVIPEEESTAESPQTEVSAPPSAPSLEAVIKADIQLLRADLRRIDTEIEQAQQDRNSIVIKLNAAIEYLELRTGEKQELKLELISGTVANGNGKHPVEVMA